VLDQDPNQHKIGRIGVHAKIGTFSKDVGRCTLGGPPRNRAGMTLDRSIFDDIEANLRSLEIDEIRKRLEPLIKGYRV
jgi:hypothetical protein